MLTGHKAAQSVTIAGGDKLMCYYMCKNFKWTLHNIEFQSDVYLLPLGSCDLVLGVQWLSALGIVKWDFKQLQMEFSYEGKVHFLKGIKGAKLQLMSHAGLLKPCRMLVTYSCYSISLKKIKGFKRQSLQPC